MSNSKNRWHTTIAVDKINIEPIEKEMSEYIAKVSNDLMQKIMSKEEKLIICSLHDEALEKLSQIVINEIDRRRVERAVAPKPKHFDCGGCGSEWCRYCSQ